MITCHGPLDSSPETLMSLEQKIKNYVHEVSEAKAPTFFERYDCSPGAEIRIVVSCKYPVSPDAMLVIERMQPIVGTVRGSLVLKDRM